MSVAVAVYLSPTEYGIAADSRVLTHIAGMVGHTTRKTFQRGDWLGAWAGTLSDAQAVLRALGDVEDVAKLCNYRLHQDSICSGGPCRSTREAAAYTACPVTPRRRARSRPLRPSRLTHT